MFLFLIFRKHEKRLKTQKAKFFPFLDFRKTEKLLKIKCFFFLIFQKNEKQPNIRKGVQHNGGAGRVIYTLSTHPIFWFALISCATTPLCLFGGQGPGRVSGWVVKRRVWKRKGSRRVSDECFFFFTGFDLVWQSTVSWTLGFVFGFIFQALYGLVWADGGQTPKGAVFSLYGLMVVKLQKGRARAQ